MNRRIEYELTQEGIEKAKDVSRRRDEFVRLGSKAYRTGYEGHDTNLAGAISEVGVAEIYDAEYNPDCRGSDGGIDMYIGPYSVQVKSTTHQRPDLILAVMDDEDMVADAYMLVVVDVERWRIWLCGWVWGDVLKARPLSKPYSSWPREARWLRESQLRPCKARAGV